MEKYIYDNSNGLWYELHGDYYLPCLVIPEEEIHTIGIWGRKHQQLLLNTLYGLFQFCQLLLALLSLKFQNAEMFFVFTFLLPLDTMFQHDRSKGFFLFLHP